jgi:hypothetical protein
MTSIMKQRILLVMYRIKDKIYGDVYGKSLIDDKLEAIHECEEIMLRCKFKKKKIQIVYKDIFSKGFKESKKLRSISKFVDLFDVRDEVIEIEEFKLPSKYFKLIMHIFNQPLDTRNIMHYPKTPPDSPRDSSDSKTTIDHYEEMEADEVTLPNPTKNDSLIALGKVSNVYELIVNEKVDDIKLEKPPDKVIPIDKEAEVVDMKSETMSDDKLVLTNEMKENIKMLKSISFIQEGDYIISGDKVILKTPVGCAYGDFIVNRQGFHHYKRDGFQVRHCRLSVLDLL